MQTLAQRLNALSSAEDFMEFFSIAHDERVLQVHRLHILQRFHQYARAADDLAELGDVALFLRYRDMLAHAYQDFVTSTAAEQKVFKVFRDAQGTRHVPLAALRDSLAARARAPHAN